MKLWPVLLEISKAITLSAVTVLYFDVEEKTVEGTDAPKWEPLEHFLPMSEETLVGKIVYYLFYLAHGDIVVGGGLDVHVEPLRVRGTCGVIMIGVLAGPLRPGRVGGTCGGGRGGGGGGRGGGRIHE
jgi:hypothetical protein